MILKRKIEAEFNKRREAYKILALVGPRQTGKTTFLKEHIKKIKGNYLTFDDPDIRRLFSKDIKKFELQYVSKEIVLVLDEVNYAENAGINLKYLADKDNILWISSSSELLLSNKVLSHLVGRVSILKLFPLSLEEFLEAKNQKAVDEIVLERLIWEHSTFGGYPKVVLTEDKDLKKTILKDLYQTMVLKDISNTFSISDVSSLEFFVKYLAINNGKVIAYDALSKNLSLSFQSVKKYLEAMKKSYLIYEVQPFFRNKSKEIVKRPKIYFIDSGMRNAIVDSFENTPSGESFENYIVSELIKKDFYPKYWRTKTGSEVDFILEKNQEVVPIEVKINSKGILESGLKNFIETYKPKKAFVVSYSQDSPKKSLTFKGCKIFFVDVQELLTKLS